MKRILIILIVGVLLLSSFGVVAINSKSEVFDPETIEYGHTGGGRLDYTHTVFVEVATAQSCGNCHGWNQNIHNFYTSGNYDFEYVEMIVYDHGLDILNMVAYNWKNIYYISLYPTSIFDGDYQRIVGDNPNQLPGALDNCGLREVKNITTSMNMSWLGDATIRVDIAIQNNEGTQYNGYIRAPIIEITSRYTTSGGARFHNGFLDYAFNKGISITPGGVYTDSITWDGNEHQDNHGNDFGDITFNNIKVIMGVFNDNNGYVDDTVAATPYGGSTPPETPAKPDGPTEGVAGVEYEFSSSTTDPDGDGIFYKFDWGDGTYSGWLGVYASGQTATASHSWSYAGDFDIRVKAKDDNGSGETAWSESLTIHIIGGPEFDIDVITGGLLKVKAKIKNTGNIEGTGVHWKIILDGGLILLGKETTGEDLTIPANGEETISSRLIFGFGQPQIKVTVEIPNGPSDSKEQGAFVFLFYIQVKVNPSSGI